ncbi:MAG: winged helix-turn-helix domain-containing protein [Arenicellales bacterium]|nr:winged helix-turn-helix domain-containing protein [Arenicellales bacterium]
MSDEPNFEWDPQSEPFLIGGFEVDAATHRIRKGDVATKLEPKAMALLLYMAQRPGSVVSRQELEREIWRGMVVGYDALNNTVAKLRKAFKDDPKNPRFIQTVPKVGYRLIAEVGILPSPDIPAAPKNQTSPHPSLERKLAAILYADVVDYSRLTGLDEEGTHHALSNCLDLMTSVIGLYGGSVVHFAGDAILAEFSTASNALSCAVLVQQELEKHNEDFADDRKMQFRIGVNLGEVIVDRNDIYGEGVNVAARLETLAEPGGVCLSGTVFDAIGHTLPLDYAFLGEREVKNIDKPVRAYQARLKAGATLAPPTSQVAVEKERSKKWNMQMVATSVLILIVASIGALLWMQPWRDPDMETPGSVAATQGSKPSIAVLPFENVSDDPAQGFYADGITGDLITDLSKLSGLAVIARHAVFAYKDQAIKLDQIAQELGVGYLLEGSVRRLEGKIRINVSLIDVGNSQSIWSERYDGDETELFDLHNRVIGNIVSILAVELTDEEETLFANPPTNNLEAYDYYLRAERRRLYFEGETVGDYMAQGQEAIELYWKAIELDPNFTEAYIGMALHGLYLWESDANDVMPAAAARKLAYDSASKVRELDPKNPIAYSILALLQATDGQHEIAIETSQRAIELGPNSADTYAMQAVVLMYAGQHEKALHTMKTAFELNPKPPEEFYGYLGRAQFFTKKYDEAALSLDKTRWFRHDRLMTYGQLGWSEKAKVVFDSVLKDIPFLNLSYYRIRLAHYKREQDMTHMIDGLRKAGVPEHAFGYKGNLENRLDSAALQKLVEAKAWRGSDNFGLRFVQQVSADGRIAFRNDTSMLVGTAWVENDMFCVKYRTSMQGREDCGYVYRNPDGTRDEQNEYVRLALGNIYYFTVE